MTDTAEAQIPERAFNEAESLALKIGRQCDMEDGYFDVSRCKAMLEPTFIQLGKAEAENRELRAQNEWVSVEEKMPPDTIAVLVWCPERKNIYTATWRVPFWYHFADGGEKMGQMVTHWMPLPMEPKV